MPSLRSASSAKSIIMIAFFLTMPISRMMPMIGDQAEVAAHHQQRQQRADAGRGQRRENRDRVDVALVEHAEHDVHRDDGRENQQQRAVERRAERFRRALEARLDAGGHADLALRGFDRGRPRRRATRPGRD